MSLKEFKFSFAEFPEDKDLDPQNLELLNKARAATTDAYAPYSNFFVGAAAFLSNKKIIAATNQENASFPVGICAERVLLSSVSALHPHVSIAAIAISYNNKNGESNHPVSPCGICRQSLIESEKRFNQPIKIILAGQTGQVLIIKTAADLLPLSFNGNDLL